MKEITDRLKQSLMGIYQLEAMDHLKIFLEGEVGLMFLLYQQNNQPLAPSEISKKLQVTKGRVTVMINSLSEKELIDISLSSTDRRMLLISLTEEGIAFIEEKLKEANLYFDIMVEQIGEEKTNILIQIMDEIRDKMKEEK